MRRIRIVSDTSCDLFTLEQTNFVCAPMKIVTAEREFTDVEALDVREMVDYLDSYKGKSKSSCPAPGDWLNAFGDADDVFCVTITSGLSGSYNSACSAKRIYESENEGKRVFVLDSLSAGPEMTLAVWKLDEYIRSGMEFDEICQSITEYIKKTGLLFMLKSVKNFANNGRISPIVAKLVGIAGICIVGKASDEGTLEPIHKIRGEKRSLDAIVSELGNEGYAGGRVTIGHCFNAEGAEKLKEKILEEYPSADVEIHKFRGLCSFYAEKGGVLVGFEKK